MAKAGVEWGWRNFLLMLSDSMFLCFSSVVLRIELRALYVAGKCSTPEPHSSALSGAMFATESCYTSISPSFKG